MLHTRNVDPLNQGVPNFRQTVGTAPGGPFLFLSDHLSKLVETLFAAAHPAFLFAVPRTPIIAVRSTNSGEATSHSVAKVQCSSHHSFIKASRRCHDTPLRRTHGGGEKEAVTCIFRNIGRGSLPSALSPLPYAVPIATTSWSRQSRPNSSRAARSATIGNVMPVASLPAPPYR